MRPLAFGTRVTINIPEGFQSDKEFRTGATTRSVSVNALNRAGGEANYWRNAYRDRIRKQYKAGKYSADEYALAKMNMQKNLATSAEVYENGAFKGFGTGSKMGGFVTAKTATLDIDVLKAQYRANAERQGYEGTKRYRDLMDEARRLGLDIWDYAEASAEGRYDDALKHNEEEVEKARNNFNDELDDLRRELRTATGARRSEILSEINDTKRKLELLEEFASEYGTGKPRDLRKRPGYSAIMALFE